MKESSNIVSDKLQFKNGARVSHRYSNVLHYVQNVAFHVLIYRDCVYLNEKKHFEHCDVIKHRSLFS